MTTKKSDNLSATSAKIKVPEGHVILTENGQQRFLELRTGRVTHLDGTRADASEQLEPVQAGVEQDRMAMLSDYAYMEQVRSIVRKTRRPARVPEHFAMSEKSPTGMRTMGERLVTMDIGQGDVHVDSAMPNYAAGYQLDEGMADIAAAPIVTGKASNIYQTWDDINSFRRVLPTGASGGGQVAEISVSKTNATYTTKPFALAGFMQTEIESNADAPLRPYQKLVRTVMEALALEREIRVATLLRTSGNWASSQYINLAAAAKWNGGASSDPVRNIRQLIETSARPVTAILMSTLAINAMTENAAVQKYFGFKQSARPLPTTGELEALLRLPPIYEAPMKYYASGTTFSYVWGGDVVLVRAPAEMPPTSQDDVATAATFRWLGGDAPDGTAQGGWLVRSFFIADRGPRGGRKIVVAHNDAEVVTSNIVGGLIAGAYQ